MLRKWIRRFFVSVLTIVALVALLDVATYDAKAWQSDYSALKRDMAQGYANLDWIVGHRHLDIRALDRETTAAIANAHSRVRAFLAIRRFIRAFNDPHFRLVLGKRPVPDARASAPAAGDHGADDAPDPPAGGDCASAGYDEEGDHAFKFPFSRLDGWQALRQGDFPVGAVGSTGVLRIAQFGENQYAAACAAVFKPGIGQYELKLATRAYLQRELTDALADLKARGVQRLLIDLTGNGGGTEWVSEAIALMTDKALERESPRMVGPGCDRSGIWDSRPVCPVLKAAEERASLQGVGAWTGPLLILVDRDTGSASEDFVVWLQQNQVARVIGERTVGAGCGYYGDGTRTRFRASPFDVRMPNCARFLDNGINEIEGIAPDLEIPMHLKNSDDQAAALAAALEKS